MPLAVTVQPLISWRAGNAIAIAEPVQKVAITATLAAEGGMFGHGRPAAKRAGMAIAAAS
jgi:hypothetical protein